ncbi:MAG: hypothetical protein AAGB51_09665 [Planctomycetota bacterium]
MNGIRGSLLTLDPKDAQSLARLYDTEQPALGVIVELLREGAADPISVSWMLKHALERGQQISTTESTLLISSLRDDWAWEAQLHICQCVRYIDTVPGVARSLASWIKKRLGHERPFVRAWALDALCALAEINPRYRRSAEQALSDAKTDSAASVRARARNLRKSRSR